ncbi:MAG: barstar family protein [Blastochloris sp.]|nr:barstar family protein [Blastochloris sp.]
MLNQKLFNSCEEPWLLHTSDQLSEEIMRKVFSLDATKMNTLNELYDEVSSKLHFPGYFGRNFNALSEMLSDLEWLPRESYIILIHNAEFLLSNEPSDVFEDFLAILSEVAEEWSVPIDQGEAWDRSSIPFHVVFQVSPQAQVLFSNKVVDAGIAISSWSPAA